MSMIHRNVRVRLAALAMAGVLGFGARAALASPIARQTCTDPTAQGTCASTSDCRKICNRLSNGLVPVCDTRTLCCTCQKL
ncbi:MAG TPA: hypothetical protein VF142_10930 [Longimicrobium sp.]